MLIAALSLGWMGCGGGGNVPHQGALGGDCFPNQTCNATLACVAGGCVMIDAAIPADAPPDVAVDALPDAGGVCNVLTQSGCNPGDKCAWIMDATMPQPVGHIGCAPGGVVATGAACMYGAPGATGYDNCIKGDVCNAGKCKVICDQNGGSPTCPTSSACATYEGLFGPVGQPVAAGVCDASCDPLADNDFLGSGYRVGTTCNSTQGCYGFPNSASPTHWSCTLEVTANKSFVHRSACTGSCATRAGNPYLNGCAQGYIPLLYDATGSTQVDCIAMCKPASCYMGNCGTNSLNLPGAAPHRCNTTDARGSFNVATTSNNGEQCAYSWFFEEGTNGLVRSATSDTVGFCMDHSKYLYDPTGGSNYSTPWPQCDTLATPGFGVGTAVGAADFACVDTATGSVTFQGKQGRPVVVDRPRAPYGGMIRE